MVVVKLDVPRALEEVAIEEEGRPTNGPSYNRTV